MRRHIAFLRRGSVVRLDAVSPTLTLLDYLRLDERVMGTKEGCAEGDCGACTVVLRRQVGGQLAYTPVNACIVLAGQADGSEVICVDDLAANGLHPVRLHGGAAATGRRAEGVGRPPRLPMRLLHPWLRDGAVRTVP
jgi:xanthine dehydrogenase small subunit